MLVKQTATLFYENINISTLNMLKKNDKYKLFKFRFQSQLERTPYFDGQLIKILKEMPQLEIEHFQILDIEPWF